MTRNVHKPLAKVQPQGQAKAYTDDATQTENTDLKSNYRVESNSQQLKIRLVAALDQCLQMSNYSRAYLEFLHQQMLTLSKEVYDRITDPERQAKEIRLIHTSVSSQVQKTEKKMTEMMSRSCLELIQILEDSQNLATNGGLRVEVQLVKERIETFESKRDELCQTLKDSSSAVITESLQTEVDKETEVERSSIQDDADSGDGSVDEDIWDRNVDPICMDVDYELDGCDANKDT